MSPPMCPNCNRPAIERRKSGPRRRAGKLCRCPWEAIALAYERQGETQLAGIAWHMAAVGLGGKPAETGE